MTPTGNILNRYAGCSQREYRSCFEMVPEFYYAEFGQPAIFRDSSSEKARMDFSRRDASLMLGYWERSDSIHCAERLSELIIVRLVYIVESFLNLVDTPATAGISLESGN